MTDIAAWRLDNGNLVVRYYGNEFTMTVEECQDLIYHVGAVIGGAKESFGIDYASLRHRRPKPVDHTDILAGLGLIDDKPKFRRI